MTKLKPEPKSPSLLDVLPLEVITEISSYLSFTAHVFFSQTCRAMRALYTEEHFKLLCQAKGFSRPAIHPRSHAGCTEPVPDFHALASNLVWHAWSCKDRVCTDNVLYDDGNYDTDVLGVLRSSTGCISIPNIG